jgi:serine/threonine protein kinase
MYVFISSFFLTLSGFGIIYRARDNKHGNICALKVIQSGAMSEIQRKDLKSEIITMQSVQAHPNLVGFYGAFSGRSGRETWVCFLYRRIFIQN